MDTIVPETHMVAPDTFMIGKPDQRRTLKGEKGMMPHGRPFVGPVLRKTPQGPSKKSA
jgi:hypothetical protein